MPSSLVRLSLLALMLGVVATTLAACGGCGCGGGTGTRPTVLTRIYVGNEGTGHTIQVSPTGAAATFSTGGGVGGAPYTMTGLAFDPATSTLYSARNADPMALMSDGYVYRYDALGVQTLFATERHDATALNAVALAMSPAGELHALCVGPNVIVRFDAAGVATLVHECGESAQAMGLCFGPQGEIYYTNYDSNGVYRVTGLLTRETIADAGDGIDGPTGVACDSQGTVYVAALNSSTVWAFDAPGSGVVFADAADGLGSCIAIAVDRDDHVWVVSNSPPALVRLDTTGAPVGANPLVDSADGLSLPRSIALQFGTE